MSDSSQHVIIELERSTDCHESSWHTRHNEEKYNSYETRLRASCQERFGGGNNKYEFLTNPGPRSYGVHCRPSGYHSKLWYSMKKDDRTQTWTPDLTFHYPRVGSFEITIRKGSQRLPVFSKLSLRRWPHPEWLSAKIEEIIMKRLGGFEVNNLNQTGGKSVKFEETTYTTPSLTDEGLRQIIKKKFSTLIAAFKSFDKNGDGCISKTEFFSGLKSSGLDLPKSQVDMLWKMCDEDNSGNLQYQEFVRRFSTYKASHSLHRHARLRGDGKQETVQKLHGVNAASRLEKSCAVRKVEKMEWGSTGSSFSKAPKIQFPFFPRGSTGSSFSKAPKILGTTFGTPTQTPQPKSLSALARDSKRMSKNVEQMSPDEIRALIYKRHGGNLLNAFRHFDLDGSNSIDYDEFLRHLPTALGVEKISQVKLEQLWRAFDPDLSGSIDMNELGKMDLILLNNNIKETSNLATKQNVKRFKGLSVDPTMSRRDSVRNMGNSNACYRKGSLVLDAKGSPIEGAQQGPSSVDSLIASVTGGSKNTTNVNNVTVLKDTVADTKTATTVNPTVTETTQPVPIIANPSSSPSRAPTTVPITIETEKLSFNLNTTMKIGIPMAPMVMKDGADPTEHSATSTKSPNDDSMQESQSVGINQIGGQNVGPSPVDELVKQVVTSF